MCVNMADNNLDEDLRWRMEAQEQTFRTYQEALKNIQQMLAQLLVNWNSDDTSGNRNEKEYNNDEHPKIEKSKKSSSVDVEIIKASKLRLHL